MGKTPIFEKNEIESLTVPLKKIFNASLASAEVRLRHKAMKYGDSWRIVEVNFLEARLIEEFEEWKKQKKRRYQRWTKRTPNLARKQSELIDLLLICFMLNERYDGIFAGRSELRL